MSDLDLEESKREAGCWLAAGKTGGQAGGGQARTSQETVECANQREGNKKEIRDGNKEIEKDLKKQKY